MSSAAVTPQKQVTEATTTELMKLLLRSASLRNGQQSQDIEATLSSMASVDPSFGKWLQEGPCLSRNAEDPDSVEGLSVDFPEALLHFLPSLPCPPCTLDNLLEATHVAIRCRAAEQNLQRELEHRQKRQMYNMAYGLSHEFNNPLANISTRAGVLLQRHSRGEDAALLKAILDSTMRGSEMLGDLMLLARPPKLVPQELNSEALLQELIQKSEPLAASMNIAIQGHWTSNGTLFADKIALLEAFWALVRNSLEASQPSQTVHLEDESSTNEFRLTIIDGGSSLSEHALQNCFDPYFSGREAGRGLGLGLAKARRLIELHKGQLSVGNIPGGGCRTRISLPWLS